MILLTRWRMIFISLLSRLSTHLLTVSHTFLLLFRQSHHLCPHTLSRHILSSLDTIHRSPILIIPEHPSLHELRAKFHALRMDIHDMRDDITSLRGSFDESSDRHSTQLSAIHHHHAEMVAIHDHRFMSVETRLDNFEIWLDQQDARFT